MSDIITTAANSVKPASSGLQIFDSGAFQQMVAIATMMAQSDLVPECLRGTSKAGVFTPFPIEKATANCLLVVEQSARWGFSPFAVAQCASVIHGRLMWEGKLVSAVLEATLGVDLFYEYSGAGDARKATVTGSRNGAPREVSGTVAQWKTNGDGSPWKFPENHDRQLAYRGAREWARRHAPGAMLGVFADDEEPPTPEPKPVTARVINPDEALDPMAPLPPTLEQVREQVLAKCKAAGIPPGLVLETAKGQLMDVAVIDGKETLPMETLQEILAAWEPFEKAANALKSEQKKAK